MTSNNNDATRELLAELARLRDDLRDQRLVIDDIASTVAITYRELRASTHRRNRSLYFTPPAEE